MSNESFIMLVVFGGMLSLMLLGIALLGGDRTDKRTKKRAAQLRDRWSGSSHSSEVAGSLRRKEEDGLSRFFTWLPSITLLRRRLERTGRNISVGKYVVLSSLLGLFVWGLLHIVFGMGGVLSGLLAIVGGVGVPHIVVGRMANKRVNTFVRDFPESIDLIVRGLRSGLPIQEGMKVVATEGAGPIKTEFTHIAELINLGVTMEDALVEVAKRLDITEFNFFVTSISLQRETGGNLAEILENISEAIRNRHMMKMKVKALSSEARASALIIGMLPVAVTLALYVMSPDYIGLLFNDFRGNIALGIALCSFTFGATVMKKMANFEI